MEAILLLGWLLPLKIPNLIKSETLKVRKNLQVIMTPKTGSRPNNNPVTINAADVSIFSNRMDESDIGCISCIGFMVALVSLVAFVPFVTLVSLVSLASWVSFASLVALASLVSMDLMSCHVKILLA